MFGFRKKHKEFCCGKGQGCGHEKRKGGRKHRHHITLSEADENYKYIVTYNPDKQTIEMGISSGSIVFIYKNHPNEANMIVGVGETRLIVPRESAKSIRVR